MRLLRHMERKQKSPRLRNLGTVSEYISLGLGKIALENIKVIKGLAQTIDGLCKTLDSLVKNIGKDIKALFQKYEEDNPPQNS